MTAWLIAASAGGLVAILVLRVSLRLARRRQALEINHRIVQGLARVKWALESHRHEDAQAAADETLAEAQRMVSDLLGARSPDRELNGPRLQRSAHAGLVAKHAD